jgi:hypothetical protein
MNITDIQMTPLLVFFTTFGMFSFGYIISFVATCFLTYLPLNDDIENEVNDDDETEYQNMIDYNFDNLDEVDLSDSCVNNLKNKFSREMLRDNGEIILCYNNETESYNYWCNTKNVYFKTLEMVSKKYVIDYNCKKLYEYTKSKKELGEQEPGEQEPGEQEPGEQEPGEQKQGEQSNIFVNLKKYNNKNVINKIVKNRYSYRGKIDDWNLDVNKKFEKHNNLLSFKEFKNFDK